MADDEIARTIRLPASLWQAIDADAKRCKRSSVKQMEAVLSHYYAIANTNIDEVAIEQTRVIGNLQIPKEKQPAPTNTALPIARPSEVPPDGRIENGLETRPAAKKRKRA